MTLSATRSLFAFAALMTSATLFAGSATEAFAATPAYRLATVAALPAGEKIIVRDVLWACSSDACVAKSANSRPAIVCATAARKIGKLNSFSVGGKDFSADELTACNAKAK